MLRVMVVLTTTRFSLIGEKYRAIATRIATLSGYYVHANKASVEQFTGCGGTVSKNLVE